MNRNEGMMTPNPDQQDVTPDLGANEAPTKVARAKGESSDTDERRKALAELEASHADFVAEGNERLAKSIQKEIDELRKDLGIDEPASGALMSRIMDVKRNEDATEAEKLRKMIMEEPGEVSKVGKEPLNPDDFDTKKALHDMIMEERGEVSPDASRDFTGEIKESPEAMRERAVKELEMDLEKNTRHIADLKHALSSVGEDPQFAETRKTLDAELGDLYRAQGLTVLNIDALRKTTLREVSDAEIDSAVDSMKVDKNAEYQALIRQMALEEAQEDLEKLPDEIGAAIDAVRTDLGDEAVRNLESKQAREALQNMTKDDIEQWGNTIGLSIAKEHELTPAQMKEELAATENVIKDREFGPAGVKSLEAALKKEHDYDPEDPKNTVGLKAKVTGWFRKLGNPRFSSLKKVYDMRLKKLNDLKNDAARLRDPQAAKRADIRQTDMSRRLQRSEHSESMRGRLDRPR